MEMEPYRRPREEWCRKSAQRRDVAGKSQQTLSLGESIKGKGEFNYKGEKFVCKSRV